MVQDDHSDRLMLARSLADDYDAEMAAALRLIERAELEPVPISRCGRFAGGPPCVSAVLLTAKGSGWPRCRISLTTSGGSYALLTTVKITDSDDGWITIGMPRNALGYAAKLLADAAG